MVKKQKSELGETLSTVIWAVGIALVLRTFLFQPFHIPSGSMLPGLIKGDYIITSKYSVGYGRHAATPLPFPRKEGRLFETEIWSETFPNQESHIVYDSQENSPSDNTRIFTVPTGHYFMMGDNRDNSGDSRFAVRNGGAGNIPATNIIGKAEIVLLSVDDDFVLYKPWTWLNMRGDRFFKRIK